ncbi:MAG: hypothetical protein KDJ29_04620, partial [Hyphomicrobiales bacterium]|nr:hypothetical protein [Hyphomicrobiales bacterium]
FVVREGRLQQLSLKTGIRGTRMIEVISGLEAGAKVVSPATAQLKTGMRVRIEAVSSGKEADK